MESKKFGNLYTLKYSIKDYFYQNKLKLLICLVFCVVGLLTGIFTAVKLFKLGDSELLEAFNSSFTITDLEQFSSNFFGRFLSYEFVSILLIVFSIHPALYIFGWCLLAYRTFLIAINCVSIILFFSFNGILKSLLILLPCQIIMLLILMLFYCYMCRQIKIDKFVKHTKLKNILTPFLIVTLCLTIVNLVETILLLIFKSSIILVI